MICFREGPRRFQLRVRAGYRRRVYQGYSSRYLISPTFRFNGAAIQLYGEGAIELGDESYIGELSTIQAAPGCSVFIGRRCRVSHNVRIYTETSDSNSNFLESDGAVIRADVSIGAGAWIGANVFIGPGIVIGASSVVGANSVVTKNVPANEIWAGVPARKIRSKSLSEASLEPGRQPRVIPS